MDPLSIIAGVTGVIGFTLTSAQSVFDTIDSVKDAPKELQSISRTAHDIAGVLSSLDTIISEDRLSIAKDGSITDVLQPLIRTIDGCHADLAELSTNLNGFGDGRSLSKWRRLTWPFKEKKILGLADKVESAKTTLGIALGTITVYFGRESLNNARVDNTTSQISRQIEEMRLEIQAQFQDMQIQNQSIDTTSDALVQGNDTELGFTMQRFLDDAVSVMAEIDPTIVDSDHLWSPTVDDNDSTTLELNPLSQRSHHSSEQTLSVWQRLEKKGPINPSDLHISTQMGNLALMGRVLDAGCDINCQWTEQRTPLMTAAWERQVSAVKFLLENGADVHAVDDCELTALHYSAQRGPTAIVRLLLDAGANLEARDVDGWTPLHGSIYCGRPDTTRVLLERGSDVFARTYERLAAIHIAASATEMAVKESSLELVKILIDHDANQLELADTEHGFTPLHHAVASGNRPTTIFLLEKKVDINAQDKTGATPLLLAADEGHDDIVRLLIQSGADVLSANDAGETAMHKAAKKGRLQVGKIILDMGKFPIECREKDFTPLSSAAAEGQRDFVEFLYNRGGDIEAKDGMDYTPLHRSIVHRRDDVVSYLLKIGADIEARNTLGWTPLHQCGYIGQEVAAIMLLERGADLEARDKEGNTPLLVAADEGETAVISVFIQHGAAILATDNAGITAFEKAADRDRYGSLELLIEGMKMVTAQEEMHGIFDSILLRSCAKGNLQVVSLMVKNSANIEVRNSWKATPFLLACLEGHLDVIRFLVEENRANWKARDHNDKNGIHIAAERGNLRVVQFLVRNYPSLVNELDAWDETPCHYASENSHYDVVRDLIRAGTDLTVIDQHGRSIWDCVNDQEVKVELQLLVDKITSDENNSEKADHIVTDRKDSPEVLDNIREIQMKRLLSKNVEWHITSRPTW